MPAVRNVVSTLSSSGEEMMGPDVMMWRYPSNDITNGSLLVVQPGAICVLRNRGNVASVYDSGHHLLDGANTGPIDSGTPAHAGTQFEAIFVTCARLPWRVEGTAATAETALVRFRLAGYLQVCTAADAQVLLEALPYSGRTIRIGDLATFFGPEIERAINDVTQRVRGSELTGETMQAALAAVGESLGTFLPGYGIMADRLSLLLQADDERVRNMIALAGYGITRENALRYYSAQMMAAYGIVSAPNMAVGAPYQPGAPDTERSDAVAE